MTGLHEINAVSGRSRRPKRVGRGIGSGHGKTSSRGHKGAGSRAGTRTRHGFEGGQMPLFRRIAKRGFSNNAFANRIQIINLDGLESGFDDGAEVSIEMLRSALSVSKDVRIKVLARGELKKRLQVSANDFSAAAEQAIAAAGGTATRV